MSEFIARKGLIALADSQITGSLNISQNLNVVGGLTASFDSSTSTAISGAFDSVSSSFASERLKNTTDTLTGDLTVTGTITAQEFHTEFVSASIIYQSGSTQFGNSDDDTHIFTGDLGVGTNDPYSDPGYTSVNVGGSNGGQFIISSGSGGSSGRYLQISSDNTSSDIQTIPNIPLRFLTSTTEKMRIQGDGNVGIGTISPSQMLTLWGGNMYLRSGDPKVIINNIAGASNQEDIVLQRNDSTQFSLGLNSADAFTLFGSSTSTQHIVVNPSGSVGIGTTSADSLLTLDASTEQQSSPSVALRINGPNEPLDSGGAQQIVWGFDYAGSARIQAYRGGSWGTSMQFLTNASGQGSDSPQIRLHIDETGNVGIGTTSPTATLQVQGEIAIGGGESADDARMYFKASDNSARFTIETDLDGITGNDILGFRSSDVDNILVFRGSGNVGIGNSNPLAKLQITTGDSGAAGAWSNADELVLESSGNAGLAFQTPNTGAATIAFQDPESVQAGFIQYLHADNALRFATNGNNERLRIDSNGRLGVGTSTFGSNSGKLYVGGYLIDGSSAVAQFDGFVRLEQQIFIHDPVDNNAQLQMLYSSANGLSFSGNNGSGNIGIGITSPSQKLDVNGITKTKGLHISGLHTLPNTTGAVELGIDSTSYNAIRFYDTNNSSAHVIHGFAANWAGGASNGHLNLEGDVATSFGTWVGPDMIVHHNSGKVGIGIGDATPDEKLHVKGGKFKLHHQANGYGWIYAEDTNHSLIIRANRSGTVGNYTHYHQYGGDYSAGGGHHFWTGGSLPNQSLRFSIANDYTIFQNTSVGIGTTVPKGELQVQGPIGIGERTGGDPVNMKHALSGAGGVTFRLHVNSTTAWKAGSARLEVASATNSLTVNRGAWWYLRLTHYRDGGVSSTTLDSGGNTGSYTLSISASTSGNPQTIDIQVTDSSADTLAATLDATFAMGIQDITDVS